MKMQNYDFLKTKEGLRLIAYPDVGGVWTIGYGHTGPEVRQGMVITADQALEYLEKDVKWAEDAVNKTLLGYDLSQNQFEALVSLTYNIGAGAFAGSTVVKRIKAGDYAGAADAITWWNKVDGKVIGGLVSRRAGERVLFLTPDAQPPLDNSVRDAKIKLLTDKFTKDLIRIIENG